MTLTVQRYSSSKESTLGLLFIDGIFTCYTLEDEFRAVKVMSETRIPEGSYELKLLTFGEHHVKYAKLFPEMHKGMLWVTNAPNFQGILIHIGNTDLDTAGCLLVGDTADNNKLTRGKITESTNAYKRFYPNVAAELLAGGKVRIVYQNIEKA